MKCTKLNCTFPEFWQMHTPVKPYWVIEHYHYLQNSPSPHTSSHLVAASTYFQEATSSDFFSLPSISFFCYRASCKGNHGIFTLLCKASLSLMFLRSINVLANVISSFFFIAEQYSIVLTSLFIHSAIDGNLDCF